MDLAVEIPFGELGAVAGAEQWQAMLDRIQQLIGEHKSTLIFVNTRRLVERVSHLLEERLGKDVVAAGLGSTGSSWSLTARTIGNQATSPTTASNDHAASERSHEPSACDSGTARAEAAVAPTIIDSR